MCIMRYVLFTRVNGVIHAFVKIAKEGGIRGLWAGWVPNVQRAALVNLGGSAMQIVHIISASKAK